MSEYENLKYNLKTFDNLVVGSYMKKDALIYQEKATMMKQMIYLIRCIQNASHTVNIYFDTNKHYLYNHRETVDAIEFALLNGIKVNLFYRLHLINYENDQYYKLGHHFDIFSIQQMPNDNEHIENLRNYRLGNYNDYYIVILVDNNFGGFMTYSGMIMANEDLLTNIIKPIFNTI